MESTNFASKKSNELQIKQTTCQITGEVTHWETSLNDFTSPCCQSDKVNFPIALKTYFASNRYFRVPCTAIRGMSTYRKNGHGS